MNNIIADQLNFKHFREAYRENVLPLTIFVGSGPSTEGGLPSWDGLRSKLRIAIANQERSYREIQGSKFNDRLYKSSKSTTNFWEFFKLARKILSPQTYEVEIRKILNTDDRNLPASYKELMKLSPKGLVTINLDTFAGEAFSSYSSIIRDDTIYGKELAKKHSVLNRENPWLLYLHGHISDSESWILTKDEISEALKCQARDFFLKKLYTQNIVLFYGMSVDDLSISDTLSMLSEAGIDAPHLYWLTSNDDYISSQWNEKHQVKPIFYKAEGNSDHLKVLKSFISQSVNFKLSDSNTPSRAESVLTQKTIMPATVDPDEVALMDPNEARFTLSSLLYNRISGLEGEQLYEEFSKFLIEYDFPIRSRAFYVNDKKYNKFFDYKITGKLGEGNFGKVYQAIDADGNYRAIKIIREEIQTSREMLGGFRRGIKSMEILSKNKVDGVVPILEAYEMPPTIVMPNVDGQSLQEIFNHLKIMPWGKKVDVAVQVASIVHECHRLPETVLHRDLKPSNIMITGFDWNTGDYKEVVVLDFDMSWHKGSDEKDIVFESRDDFGYLAPEQTNSNSVFLSRSAKVDSFGLAMTLYALLGGEHPRPEISMDDSRWGMAVKRAVGQGFRSDFQCLKNRIIRIILAATKKKQDERLDFLYLYRRLTIVSKFLSGDISYTEVDILLEQVMYELAQGKNYIWDDLGQKGILEFVSGISVKFAVNSNNTTNIEIYYQDPGNVNYSKRNQALAKAKRVFNTIEEIGINPISKECQLQNQYASYKYLLDSTNVFEENSKLSGFLLSILSPMFSIQ